MERYIIDKSRDVYVDASGEETILKDYELPASVTFLDKLPRTDMAEKIDYEYLKRMAEEEYKKEQENQKKYTKK